MDNNDTNQGADVNTDPVDANQQPSDAQIEVSALKDLLKENTETIKSLKDELVNIKKENAKLIARIDVSNKVDPAKTMNDLFNKYSK